MYYDGPIITGPLPGTDGWDALWEAAYTAAMNVSDLLNGYLSKITVYFSWLPTEFVGVLLVAFGVVILFKVLEYL